jgi:tetratricopeptide (TPR) repeat protein
MDRRRFLLVTGSTGLTAAFAGCSGGDDDGDTDDGNTDGGPSEQVAVEPLLDSADENLDEVETKFGEQLSNFDPEEPGSIETAEIEKLLDDARSDLEEARPHATGGEEARLAALEGTHNFFRGFVDTVVELSGAVESFNTANSHIESEQWTDATTALREAEESMDAANEQFDSARAEFDRIKAEDLGSSTQLEIEDLESDLDELEGVFVTLDILITSLRQASEGFPHFESGQSALEAGNFTEAADEFDAASERFTASMETLSLGQEQVPQEFQSDISQLLCQFEAFRDAMDHLESSAELFDQGENQQAQEEADAAQTRIAEAENCGSSAASLSVR